MVCWVAIRLHENLIVNYTVVEDNLAVDEIFPLTDSMRDKHPHNVLFSTGYPLLDLFFTKIEAKPVVFSCLMLFTSLF